MKHEESVRLCGRGGRAVLFIHGILGTPNHFREFLPLVPDTVSVYNMLLDGHGKGVGDFSKTSMKKWEAQVSSVVEQLSETHEEIYIAAHSLGTLLAVEQAVKNPKITRLFLLAVPLRIALKPGMVLNALKVYFDRIRPDDLPALAAKNCYGIEDDRNPLRYLGWTPRFLELFAKIRRTRGLFPVLKTPCAAYQSQKDEMVSQKSLQYLKQNSFITVNTLANSGHFYYEEADKAYLLAEFAEMMKK